MVRLAVRLEPRLLRRLEHDAVVRLLQLVVLREQRALLLAVRALDVVQALREHAHLLVELLLLLLQLLDLEPHEVVRAETLHVLSQHYVSVPIPGNWTNQTKNK